MMRQCLYATTEDGTVPEGKTSPGTLRIQAWGSAPSLLFVDIPQARLTASLGRGSGRLKQLSPLIHAECRWLTCTIGADKCAGLPFLDCGQMRNRRGKRRRKVRLLCVAEIESHNSFLERLCDNRLIEKLS